MPRAAQAAAILPPVAGEPTNTTFLTAGLEMAAWPVVWPKPLSTLMTPLGRPACSASAATASELSGVSSEGLSSTALPAAMAGATFQPQVNTGAFQGVISSSTPKASRRV